MSMTRTAPARPDRSIGPQAHESDGRLRRLGHRAASHPWLVIAGWALLVGSLLFGGARWGGDLDAADRLPGSESQRAYDLLVESFPTGGGLDATVVLGTGDTVVIADYVDRVDRLDDVVDIGVPLTSPNGEVTGIQLTFATDAERSSLDALLTLGERFDDQGVRVGHAGDLLDTFEPEEGIRAELIGLIAAAGIMLIAFGSILAMLIPLGSALIAVSAGLAAAEILATVWPVPEWAPLLGSMIGIGVGLDYALFIVTRHREHLANGHDPTDAAGLATATAGLSVLFAGGTVVISILGLAIAGLPIVTSAAAVTSIIVLIVVAASITLVPAFLGLFGHAIERYRVPGLAAPASDGISPRWHRWVSAVSRHRVAATIASIAVIGLLTAPALNIDLAFPDDTVLPEDRPERVAYDLLTEGFGEGANTRFVAVLRTTPAELTDTADAVSAAMIATPGVGTVLASDVNPTGDAAIITAFGTTSPADPATRSTLDALRAAINGIDTDPTTQVFIGGQTASELDLAERLTQRTPWIVAAVAALSFAALVILFRSILVPLKAVLLNLASVATSYGAVVAVFQWGWLSNVLPVEASGPISPLVPMFAFAVLFGLSMDYEVFLLSRIKEHHRRTGDTNSAVIAGLSGTARVITSAALIMISVFVGFVFASDPIIKTLAVGLAVAIAVDATIVRTVLVPATMQMLGERNWWIPKRR